MIPLLTEMTDKPGAHFLAAISLAILQDKRDVCDFVLGYYLANCFAKFLKNELFECKAG